MLALELQGYPSKERKERALKLIDQVGLTKQKHQKSSKLSGGQKQRAVIARALAKDTPIIVCDEPTGNLDTKTGEEVMNLFQELNDQGQTIILITNEDDIARQSKRIINIKDGLIESDIKI